MKRIKILMIILLSIFIFSFSYAGVESDANISNISVFTTDNSAYVSWNKWTSSKYYEFTIESIYGTYSQKYTTLDTYKQIGLTDAGLYKITLQAFDGVSSVEYDMGYYYFSFGNGSIDIDPKVLADAISSNLDITQKEVDKKVYRFRVVWNSSWWSGLSVSNSSDTRIDVAMIVVNPNNNTTSSATISVQPNDIIKGTGLYFLSLAGIDVGSNGSDRTDYLVTFECPPVGDIELYTGQLLDGKMVNLTKDTSIDDYIYKE